MGGRILCTRSAEGAIEKSGKEPLGLLFFLSVAIRMSWPLARVQNCCGSQRKQLNWIQKARYMVAKSRRTNVSGKTSSISPS